MPDLLKKYKTMRDFGATPEPAGAARRKKRKLPIFVIQKHHASHLHYDFRLEMEGVLKSWAVPKGPSYDPAVKRLAMMTEDHPYDYASFEGVIPEGNYGAGNVIIWDEGGWEFLEGDDPVKAVRSGKLTFRLYGKKMFGEWALIRIHGRSPKGNEWLLLKHRDEFANETIDITEVAPRSVVSKKLVDEVGGGRTWQSNREASVSGRNAPTIASRLAAKGAAGNASAKKRASAGTRGKSATKRAGAATKTSRKAAAKKSASPRKRAAATKTARRSGPARSPAAPSRGASARTRSSRAGSPRKARPTQRRRPR